MRSSTVTSRKHITRMALMTVVALAACSHEHGSAKPGRSHQGAMPSATVRTLTLARGGSDATEEVIGTVRAKVHATIEAKLSGRVTSMPVQLGQAVKRGALLVELDAGEIRARYEQARAVQAQAKIELDRATALLKASAGTQNEYDAVHSRYQVATASLAEARSMLGYARVTAPFAGVVTQKSADVGDLASPGKPLLEMEQPGGLRLEVGVPEALIRQVARGAKVPVQLEQIEQRVMGTVGEVAPAADANTRTFLTKIELPAHADIRSGQLGRAFFAGGRQGFVKIPRTALIERGQLEIAFVVENATASMRLIKTGKRYDQDVEVVAGLQPGEQVVVEVAQQPGGLLALRDGQPVKVQP